MARWTQTWLSGVGAAQPQADADHVPGRDLGLPAEGAGAPAGQGRKLVAFLVDVAVGALLGRLVVGLLDDPSAGTRSLATNGGFAVQYVVLTALAGQTIGMRLLGLRVVSLKAPGRPPGLLPSALRTALLMLLVPAAITDRDRRGLHDRAASTVVVRA